MTEPSEPIARIEAALSKLGAEHEPPLGWEARVLAATAPPRRRAWWWFAAPAMLAAAALVVVLMLLPHKDRALQLSVVFDKSATVVRGPGPQLGDTVHVTAAGGGAHRAVWVYHNETVQLINCPGSASCRAVDDAVTADLKLEAIGSYQIVALASNATLPVPTGRFDDDVAAAERANLTVSRQELMIR